MYHLDDVNFVTSPDLEAESSFPERHFTLSYDDEKDPAVDSVHGQLAVSKPQPIEPAATSLWSEGWSSRIEQLHHRNLPSQAAPFVENPLSTPSFSQTASRAQAECDLLRRHSLASHFGHFTQHDFSLEDELDGNPLANDGSDGSSPTTAGWPLNQRPRRRSPYRITKPSQTLRPGQHSPTSRFHVQEFNPASTSIDWRELTEAFQTAHGGMGTVAPYAASDVTDADFFLPPQETGFSSSPSNHNNQKADSKRIAHKLSEKSRRNRLTIAIREIQKLLPTEMDRDRDFLGDGSTLGSRSERGRSECDYVIRPGVPSSKLDVVEMAVGFIKDLKQRNKDLARRAREAESKLQKCRCQQERHGERGVDGQGETG